MLYFCISYHECKLLICIFLLTISIPNPDYKSSSENRHIKPSIWHASNINSPRWSPGHPRTHHARQGHPIGLWYPEPQPLHPPPALHKVGYHPYLVGILAINTFLFFKSFFTSWPPLSSSTLSLLSLSKYSWKYVAERSFDMGSWSFDHVVKIIARGFVSLSSFFLLSNSPHSLSLTSHLLQTSL